MHKCSSVGDLPASDPAHALLPMHAYSDYVNTALEASACISSVALSAEVRVLVREKGSLKVAFRERPYVYFSRFASTLLWAAAMGLGILARSPDLKSEDSWLLRLAGHESRTLRACVCAFIGLSLIHI